MWCSACARPLASSQCSNARQACAEQMRRCRAVGAAERQSILGKSARAKSTHSGCRQVGRTLPQAAGMPVVPPCSHLLKPWSVFAGRTLPPKPALRILRQPHSPSPKAAEAQGLVLARTGNFILGPQHGAPPPEGRGASGSPRARARVRSSEGPRPRGPPPRTTTPPKTVAFPIETRQAKLVISRHVEVPYLLEVLCLLRSTLMYTAPPDADSATINPAALNSPGMALSPLSSCQLVRVWPPPTRRSAADAPARTPHPTRSQPEGGTAAASCHPLERDEAIASRDFSVSLSLPFPSRRDCFCRHHLHRFLVLVVVVAVAKSFASCHLCSCYSGVFLLS